MQHMKGPTIATFIEMIKVVDMKGQTRTEYIEDWMNYIEMIIQNLDYDKEIQPLKLMGLTCSYDLLTSIYTALASAAFAISQILYSRYA